VVSELDWSVGELLKTLREQKLDQNTLVIFTSDNGPWLLQKQNGGSAGHLFEGKGTTYEGGMRVPAIAWWPGKIKAGQINQALAATMDLLPTILALAKVEMPKDKEYDGTNIWPLLGGEKAEVREFVYYYHRSDLRAIRKGKWKAHFSTRPSPAENVPQTADEIPLLFNLDIDPSEKYDVGKNHPEIVAEMKKEYNRHKAVLVAAPSVMGEVIKKQ
jgi:arylsulfatase A-like enzyme